MRTQGIIHSITTPWYATMAWVESKVLPGERIELRTLQESDRTRVVEIRRTEEVFRRWGGGDLDEEFAEGLADEEIQQFAIVADGATVGMIQFSKEEDPDYRHASIDVFVDPAFHRRGYASDAITTRADHLFDERGHHRLTIDPAHDNRGAIECYRRVGFREVGVMRAYERTHDGTWHDGLLLDMLVTDRDVVNG